MKERQANNYCIELGICATLIILTALGLIPLPLCIALCLLSFISTAFANWIESDDS